MKQSYRSLLVRVRTLLLAAFVATSFSSCQILGATVQLVGKVVRAFVGNTVDAIPVRIGMSVPLRPADRGSVVGTTGGASEAHAPSSPGNGELRD